MLNYQTTVRTYMDDIVKNKKRALRRRRNMIAKDLKENKLYRPKVVELKRKRAKVTVRQVEQLLEGDLDV